jgi:hypothetical protein
MHITGEDKACKVRVIEKCWGYLFENFHKFNDSNKIRVALALCTKDIPQELKGEGLDKQIIIIRNDNSSKEQLTANTRNLLEQKAG